MQTTYTTLSPSRSCPISSSSIARISSITATAIGRRPHNPTHLSSFNALRDVWRLLSAKDSLTDLLGQQKRVLRRTFEVPSSQAIYT